MGCFRTSADPLRHPATGLPGAAVLVATAALSVAVSPTPRAAEPAADAAVADVAATAGDITADTFTVRIAPLLARHCGDCHGADTQEGSLRLDSHAGLAAGGGTGAVIVPGSADESLLVQAVRRLDESLAMPPDGPIPAEDGALLAAWIDAGAPHPDGPLEPQPGIDLARARRHWSLVPPERPDVPDDRHPIDALLDTALDAEGLLPTAPADPATLVRRVTFDLTGLPPTPDEIDAFVADPSAAAFDRLVDRLLASPHYGEHWGRHWLDVVRYADSNGLDENVAHGNAWRYRDYVIAAFNADKPFDAFLREQLAGDLLVAPDDSPDRVAELLTATGYLVLGPKVLAEGDERKLMMDIIDEQIDTTGRAFLGLSLGCARCHDHKFDPVSQADYYALAGIFQSTRTMESLARIAKWHENVVATPAERAAHEAHQRRIDEAQAAVDRFLTETRTTLAQSVAAVSPADTGTKSDGAIAPEKPAAREIPEAEFPEEARKHLAALREAQKQLAASLPKLATAMGVVDAEPTTTRIHLRGSHLTLGRTVERGVPAVFTAVAEPVAMPAEASGRRELARWLTDPGHPLTARVIANRLWRWHFGRGLVTSTDNFGITGAPPTNQPLLDWLAVELVESGWSLKHLHRLILSSAAWRRSSDPAASPTAARARQVDPDNRLWWRADVRRLEAESVRDALLATAGMLDRTMGGSLLHVGNREFVFNHTSKDETSYDAPRRSVYLPVIRNHIQDALWLFDCTDGAVANGDRATSTVASQALWLLNAQLPLDAAQRIAESVMAAAPHDTSTRTLLLFRRILGRQPTAAEAAWLGRRLDALRATLRNDDAGTAGGGDTLETAAWAAAAQALLMSDAFMVVR